MASANAQLSTSREDHAKVIDELVKEKDSQLKQLRDELTQAHSNAKVDGEKTSRDLSMYVLKISALEKELEETKSAKVATQFKLDQVHIDPLSRF